MKIARDKDQQKRFKKILIPSQNRIIILLGLVPYDEEVVGKIYLEEVGGFF